MASGGLMPMTKPSLPYVLVVEGRADTQRLQEVFDVWTIETGGSAVSQETLDVLKNLVTKRPIVVFTDPDWQGRRIRQLIMAAVPEVGHAFITPAEGRPKQGSLGVEHASDEALQRALAACQFPKASPQAAGEVPSIPQAVLYRWGLVAGPQAKAKREYLAKALHIGYTNGKQLGKRLALFQITEEQLAETMAAFTEGGDGDDEAKTDCDTQSHQ